MEHADSRQPASSLRLQDKATQLMFAANSFLCQGKHMEALELYTEVLTRHCPEHPHALINRSLAYIVLSYPELGAADAFRAAVLVTRVGDPGWPPREDIQEYLDMVYAAKKSHLSWAYGMMTYLDGKGMDVSPCSVSLEICPDDEDNVSCYDFWYEVECKAKYRLALALWRCGGGAVRDALNVIEDYLKVCPADKAWGLSFLELGNHIMHDLAELIYAEDCLKDRLFKDGILRRGTDDEDKFDMRGIRGLVRAKITMAKREIYPWNKFGREINKAFEPLTKMVMACAPKCRVAVVNDVNSGAAKMPTFILYAGEDIFPGQEILEEVSLIQAATTTTEPKTLFFCDACAALIDFTSKTTPARPALNSVGDGHLDEKIQDKWEPAVSCSHSTQTFTNKGQDSGKPSESATSPRANDGTQGGGIDSIRSHPKPIRTSEVQDSEVYLGSTTSPDNGVLEGDRSTPVYTDNGLDGQVPSEGPLPPLAGDGAQSSEDIVPIPPYYVPIHIGDESSNGSALENCSPIAKNKTAESSPTPSGAARDQEEPKGDAAPNTPCSPSTDDGKQWSEEIALPFSHGLPFSSRRELIHDSPSSNSLQPVTADNEPRNEDSGAIIHPIPVYISENEHSDGAATPMDPGRTPTPELGGLPPDSESVLCNHCRKAYFCSRECIHYAMAEYHLYAGCWGLEGYVRRNVVDDTGEHHIIPDMIPTAHARIYELLLARIFTLAIQRGEHPLEIEEVRHLPGGFFVAPRFVTAFDSSDSDDGLTGEDYGPDHTEQRRTLPWSYEANIKRPFRLLEKMGLNIFQELEWFDAWVINTLMAKIMSNTRFTRGETDGFLVGSIHPVLSAASRATAGWNCEIDGDEGGLYRTILASQSQHTDSKVEDSIPSSPPSYGKYAGKSPPATVPCINAGEEIFLRTGSLQVGVDAASGKATRLETWIERLKSRAAQVGDNKDGDLEPEALGGTGLGFSTVRLEQD